MRTPNMLAVAGLAFTVTVLALPTAPTGTDVDHPHAISPEPSSIDGHPWFGPPAVTPSVLPFTDHLPSMTGTLEAAVHSHESSFVHRPTITAPSSATRSLSPRPAQPKIKPEGTVKLSPGFTELLARHIDDEKREFLLPTEVKIPAPDATTALKGPYIHEPGLLASDATIPVKVKVPVPDASTTLPSYCDHLTLPPREPAAAGCTVKWVPGGQVPHYTTVRPQPQPAYTPCIGCNTNQWVEKCENSSIPVTHSVTRVFPWPKPLESITKTVTALETTAGETSHHMVAPSPFPTLPKREVVAVATSYPDTKTILPSTVLTFSSTRTTIVALPTPTCNSMMRTGCIGNAATAGSHPQMWAVWCLVGAAFVATAVLA